MSKYHINNKGNVTQCRAKKKCPFGGESGMENHYESKELALKAYESQMKEKLNNLYKAKNYMSNLKNSNNSFNYLKFDKDSSLESQIINFNNFIKENGVNNISLGRVSEKQPLASQSKLEEYNKIGKDLINLHITHEFSEEFDGYYNPPQSLYEEDEYYWKNRELEGTGFKIIGSGARNNAYLHEESGMVYKIPNFDYVMEDWNEDNSPTFVEQNIIDAEVLSDLDIKGLEAENIEYAETYYSYVKDDNETTVPIIIQKYLDPTEYSKYKMPREIQRDLEIRFRGLYDMHSGNVRINKKTGRIVLLDCI